MSKTANRKNNCTVHFMVNEEVYKEDIESIKKALQGELLFLSKFRERVSDYIINEVVG